MRFHKKGADEQPSGSVAGLVILLTVLGMILFYVFTVPAAEREILNITGPQYVILEAQPGAISAGTTNISHTYKHTFPTITIDNTPKHSELFLRSQLFVQRGIFSEDFESVTFNVVNKSVLSEASLKGTVTSKTGSGNLIILLNGKKVYSAPANLNSALSIQLPLDLLVEGTNNLTVAVSSPGWAFWSKNSYQLSDVKLAFSQYTYAKARASQLVSLSSEEVDNLERAQISAYLTQISLEPKNVKLLVNNEELLNTVPPSFLQIDIPSALLHSGTNTIEWEVGQDGIYQITYGKLILTTTSTSAQTRQYEFMVPENLWSLAQSGTAECTLLLERDANKSAGNEVTVDLNSNIIEITFHDGTETRDVCNYLTSGKNSIRLFSSKDIYISKLKIILKE